MFSALLPLGFSLSAMERGFSAPLSPAARSAGKTPFVGILESGAQRQNPSRTTLTGRPKTSQIESCKAVAVLYARKNSVYNKIDCCDVFDLARDARTFSGQLPVIAHPPCRLWGRLRQFSTAPIAEKALAIHAVDSVRRNGGVLEHPAWSSLWLAAELPLPGVRDSFGGFTYPILQSWFGHKAPKATWLYIVGIEPADLPAVPFELGIPVGRICATGSMKVREGTPPVLAKWLVELAVMISNRQYFSKTAGHSTQRSTNKAG